MEQTQQVQQVVESLNFFQWSAKFMDDGGVFMWVILSVWAAGAAVAIERFFRIKRYDVDAPSFMNDIKKHVFNNDVPAAIQYCAESSSILAKMFKAGLKRVNQSRQQIQDIIEATILECNGDVNKGINWVGLIANVCTLFGLLGTIQGLILTFGNVSVMDPTEKAKLLAVGISTAMNTTALGLVCSISLLFAHMYLSLKVQKITGDLDEQSMRLIDLLGSRKAIAEDDKEAA